LILHAGLIARFDRGRWRGVLIQGPSGSGKSDLALRAMAAGFRLVADDRVLLWADAGRLFGRAPEPLAGRIEVRGVGVAAAPARAFSAVDLIVICTPAGEIERIPDAEQANLLGVSTPCVKLPALEPSGPAKLRYALSHLGGRS
jgi:serine kinase of HPr protein (carbohydrate metabolism regulator)